ncbi:MAG: hypothetical protein JXC33_05440 [Deltaproteobacteria bacterium]|nr:hypothetical protein [Deltaproteobacteria bacterium]
MMKLYSFFSHIHVIILVIGLSGFACSFLYFIMIRRHIAKEKLTILKDPSVIFQIPLPAKQVLSNEGVKYYYGFHIGMGLFIICLLLLILISYL